MLTDKIVRGDGQTLATHHRPYACGMAVPTTNDAEGVNGEWRQPSSNSEIRNAVVFSISLSTLKDQYITNHICL